MRYKSQYHYLKLLIILLVSDTLDVDLNGGDIYA